MYAKLTIPERLKDLRVMEKHLTLEELAEQTGLSKSALGKYETDEYKDISPFAIVTLAEFYGVSTGYLLGLTETKNHPNTTLDELHLSDAAIDILKNGKLNNRLICEILCHEDFRRLLVDSEVFVDRIAEMHTEEFISIMNVGRLKVLEKSGDENALDARTLEIAEEVDKHYIEGVLTQDLLSILNDIREKHLTDSTTADAPYTADEAQKKIDEVMNFKGSEREKQLFLVCNQLQIPYNTLKPDEKAALLSAISKSKILGKLGKHGRGKRKHKK